MLVLLNIYEMCSGKSFIGYEAQLTLLLLSLEPGRQIYIFITDVYTIL